MRYGPKMDNKLTKA